MTQPLNTPVEVMLSQARENLKLELPLFLERGAHTRRVLIVGGGPSLRDSMPQLHREASRGAVVMALNNTHDWLFERGIKPGLHVMLDAREENAAFVQRPRNGVTYLIAAQCHPRVLDALAGHQVVLWVADVPGMAAVADEANKPVGLIGGGSTVGMKAMCLAYLWGFRSMSLFGFDGCYQRGEHHAYPQALNDNERRVEATFNGKTFTCAPWMVQQAHDFDHYAKVLTQAGVSLKTYGTGLLPSILENHRKELLHAA